MTDHDPPEGPEHARVRRVKERHAAELLRRQSVTAVGIGYEEVGGVGTGRLAVRVYVRRKGSFPPGERLPDEISGVPFDVVEAEFRAAVATAVAPRRAAPAPAAD